jgi:hypothetical protein
VPRAVEGADHRFESCLPDRFQRRKAESNKQADYICLRPVLGQIAAVKARDAAEAIEIQHAMTPPEAPAHERTYAEMSAVEEIAGVLTISSPAAGALVTQSRQLTALPPAMDASPPGPSPGRTPQSSPTKPKGSPPPQRPPSSPMSWTPTPPAEPPPANSYPHGSGPESAAGANRRRPPSHRPHHSRRGSTRPRIADAWQQPTP